MNISTLHSAHVIMLDAAPNRVARSYNSCAMETPNSEHKTEPNKPTNHNPKRKKAYRSHVVENELDQPINRPLRMSVPLRLRMRPAPRDRWNVSTKHVFKNSANTCSITAENIYFDGRTTSVQGGGDVDDVAWLAHWPELLPHESRPAVKPSCQRVARPMFQYS